MRKVYAILVLLPAFLLAGQYVSAQCTPGPVQTFTNNTAVAIPAGPAVVTSTLLVSGAPAYLYDVNVTTFITHTFAADLDITITSPAGTVVTLTSDNGGGNDNVYNGTVWDDNANPGGQVPYTTNNGMVNDHAYVNLTLASPLAPEEALGAFIGEDPNGTWTITISDDAGGDAGNLSSWSLDILGLSSAPVTANSVFTNNTPVAIPAGPAVVSSTINVTGAGTQLLKLNLTTFITHTFAGDLDITITSPAGTVVTLTSDNGGGNDNVYNGTVWDDDANPGGQVPYTTNNGLVNDHAYVNLALASPLAPEEALAAFIGEDPNGTWTITISDDAGGDAGNLSSWSLDITTATCSVSGPCPTPPAQVFSNNTPVAIPAGPAVVSSTISVAGAPAYLTDLNVTTFITHTFAADLDITITSPAGTIVTLTTDNGGGNDNVFNGTIWDDQANPGSQVPYTSNNGVVTEHTFTNLVLASPLVPEEALGAFVGEDPNGTWTITISDDAGGDAGSLDSWSLDIVGYASIPITAVTVVNNNTPVAIPSGPAVVNSTLNVAGAGTQLVDLNLTTFITHTFAGDLDITITSPAGTIVTLTTDNGGGNDNVFNGTIWDDQANPGSQVPYTSNNGVVTEHTFTNLVLASPLVPEEALGAFVGEDPNGTWTITISDDAGGDAGSLDSWSLSITTSTCAGCSPPVISLDPVDAVICSGADTSFKVVSTGSAPFTYRWQIDQGAGFIDLVNVAPFSGVNTDSLIITGAGVVYDGDIFRCIVSNACGEDTSATASLTVHPIPTVNAGPSGICAPVTLTANGNANTYAWTPATGLNTTTGTTVIATPVANTNYTVTGTITATGCTNSATVTVLGTPPTPVITPAAPVICAGTIQPLTVAPIQYTFNSSGGINIPATGTSGIASPYPGMINVTGLPTTGVRVKSITINGLSHTFPSDIDMLLQSPTGTNVVLLSDAGGGTDIVNGNVVFDDAAPGPVGAVISSGTYQCTNVGATDTWTAPGPGSVTQATPSLSLFSGDPNGNWNLFIVDDVGGDLGAMTGWSIVFEVETAVWSPVTGLFTNPAATVPYVAGTPVSTVYFQQSPTVQTNYTYTVTNVQGPCSSGPATVTVTVNPLPTIAVAPSNQCGPVTLTATGNSNTYTWSPSSGLSSTTGATVTANPLLNTTYTVTGTITATGCSISAPVNVLSTPAAPVVTPTSVNICLGSTTTLTVQPTDIPSGLGSTILIPAGAPGSSSGTASPYPGTISIGGLPTSGVRVKSVHINGISHTFPSDIDMLLQSPSGNYAVLMSDAGGGTDIVNGNVVFDDAAAGPVGGTLTSGTYQCTNVGATDTWTAPGPGSVTQVTPSLSLLTGDPNGNWRLFVVDDAGGDVGSITSWSITFEIVGAVWTPVTGLYTDPGATIPYVAGTMVTPVYAKPTTTTVYTATRASATCTSAGTNVTVTVYQPVSITTQPANQTVCVGANATFNVVASGNFLTYQWQVSTNGGTTWTNITNANAASLVVASATLAQNGNQYRVIITNSCNTVTSNAATLTVNAPTTVNVTDLWNQRICISDTLVPLNATPVGGSWSGPGVSGFNFIPGATAVGNYILTYTYTNSFGCTSTDTTRVIVQDCQERIRLLRNDAVILFPNPNNGRFNIRINSTLYNRLGMRVFSMSGQLVKVQDFSGLVYGRVVPIDLSHLPSASYLVKFYYDDGIRTAEKGFIVIVARD